MGLQDEPLHCTDVLFTKQHHGANIFSAFTSIIADPMSPLILHPLSTLDIVIQSLAASGAGQDVWPQLVDQTGLLAALVGSLLCVKVRLLFSFLIHPALINSGRTGGSRSVSLFCLAPCQAGFRLER